MTYQPLISNQIWLVPEDIKALKWLYNCVKEQDPVSVRSIEYLNKAAIGQEISQILIYQVKSLLISMDFSIKNEIFGYKRYLTKWCEEKEQHLQSV